MFAYRIPLCLVLHMGEFQAHEKIQLTMNWGKFEPQDPYHLERGNDVQVSSAERSEGGQLLSPSSFRISNSSTKLSKRSTQTSCGNGF